MKLVPLLCAAALTVGTGSAAADSSTPKESSNAAEKIVEARSRALIKAELEADVEAFRSYLSDDYVMLYVEPATAGQKARWATMTKEEWATLMSTGREKYHSVKLRDTKVYLHGDVAIFAGEYSQRSTTDGKESREAGLFTETWVKRHGQWILIGGVFP
jgi:ketosteroid isomerase-like protein